MGLPLQPPPMAYEIEQLMAFMSRQKARDGKLTLILERASAMLIGEKCDPMLSYLGEIFG
jgi:hypothetical protein